MARDVLSTEDLYRAYALLRANGTRPAFSSSAHREPMRGDAEALAVLLDDLAYHQAAMAAVEDTAPVYHGGPWVLHAVSPEPEYHLPRKGPKDSTHVPFYKSLPKFKRRR